MSTTSALTAEQRSVLNSAFTTGRRLGRPFCADDCAGIAGRDLLQAAVTYAQTCDASWSDWLRKMQMKAQLGTFLNAGEAKGVLNCLMADARKRQAAKQESAPAAAPAQPAAAAPAVDLAAIPDGTFTVVLPGGAYSTIKVEAWKDYTDRRTGAKVAGVRSFRYLAGPDNELDFQYFGHALPSGKLILKAGHDTQRAALQVILRGDHLAELGMAYALRSSRCFRCNRKLTVPASIHSGLGPDCAEAVGAAYGPPPAPAVAEAMQEPAPVAAPVAPALPVLAARPSMPIRRCEHGHALNDDLGRAQPPCARCLGRARTYADLFPDPEEDAA